MLRIDTHHHAIPSFYRDLLREAKIDEAGGRELPEWSPEGSLRTMAELNVATAILSVSTPGTAFLPGAQDATSVARDVNDYLAELTRAHPDRFGFFATVPMPHLSESVDEVARSLDELGADASRA
jgi:6-methylsalicylate decarboxylase